MSNRGTLQNLIRWGYQIDNKKTDQRIKEETIKTTKVTKMTQTCSRRERQLMSLRGFQTGHAMRKP